MSTSDEEKDYIIECAVETLFIDIVLTGYKSKDELLEAISEKLREM